MSENDKKLDKTEVIVGIATSLFFIGYAISLFLKGDKDGAILMAKVMGLGILFLCFIFGAISLASKDTAKKIGRKIGGRPANIIRNIFLIFWVAVGVGFFIYVSRTILAELLEMLVVILGKLLYYIK